MTVVGVVRAVAGDETNGADMALYAGHDFDGGEHATSAVNRRDAEVKSAVARGGHIGEDLHVGGAASTGVGHNVKAVESRLAIDSNRHQTAAFASSEMVFGAILRFGKVQTQFVDTGPERDVVGEVSLAAVAID